MVTKSTRQQEPPMTPQLRERIAKNKAKGFELKGFKKAPQGGWYAVYEKKVTIDSVTAWLDRKEAEVSGADLGQWTTED